MSQQEPKPRFVRSRFYEVAGALRSFTARMVFRTPDIMGQIEKRPDFLRWVGEPFVLDRVTGVIDQSKHALIKADWIERTDANPNWWMLRVTVADGTPLVRHQVVSRIEVWRDDWDYEIVKSPAHPDVCPKKRLIDMSKLPAGVAVSTGIVVEVPHSVPGVVYTIWPGSHRAQGFDPKDVRLNPNQPWIENPQDNVTFPEGVAVEVAGNNIRIHCVLQGWTDNPAEA